MDKNPHNSPHCSFRRVTPNPNDDNRKFLKALFWKNPDCIVHSKRGITTFKSCWNYLATEYKQENAYNS